MSDEPTFPQVSTVEQLKLLALHNVNALARGIVLPRPKIGRVLNRLDTDRRLVELMNHLYDRYQGRPVWSNGITGTTLLVLSPTDMRRVLSASDELYQMATPLKRRLLGHIQPDGLILSTGPLRETRRQFNEVVLDWGRDVHREAGHFVGVVEEEIEALLAGPMATGRALSWRAMRRTFQRMSRRCVLGDVARDDVEFSELFDALRREGNWLGLRVWRKGRTQALRARLYDRIHRYVELGQAGSLVGRFADLPTEARVQPAGQVAHWLLAFDVLAGISARALALLATHPRHLTPIEEEIADADRFHEAGTAASVLAMPTLRATAMEAARLWPVVRDLPRLVTRDVDWDGALVPQGSEVLMQMVYHGRAAYRGRSAHRFTPQQWLDGTADGDWGLSPASRGPAGCPGADLGFFLITAVLATCMRGARFRLLTEDLRSDRPLPYSYDPSSVKFAVADKPDAAPTVMVAMGPGELDFGDGD